MKVKVLQIVWHNKEPVFSVDFHPSGVLASAGADGEIKLWRLEDTEGGDIEAEFLSSITGDKSESGFKTWNCVRFCPTGQSLAAAGDMGQIYLWKPAAEGAGNDWRGTNCGAYSAEDVVDLCWSSDGSGFITASNDMTCMIWEPETTKGGKAKLRLEGHRLYVQGVAWDPLHQYIVSQGADRSCRVYSMRQAVPGLKKKAASKHAVHRLDGLYCSYVINKGSSACKTDPEEKKSTKAPGQKGIQHLFHDESLSTFFRRLAWSPDGSLLVVPAGLQKSEAVNANVNIAYIFARGHWHSPLMQLPVAPKAAVAVRFCPILFQLEEIPPGRDSLPIDLPYRMVFAVATRDSVIIYDTQSMIPLVVLGGLHLEVITDLAWSHDGRLLAVSSYDCYCSVASFEEGELGVPANLEIIPSHIKPCLFESAATEAEWAKTLVSSITPRNMASKDEEDSDSLPSKVGSRVPKLTAAAQNEPSAQSVNPPTAYGGQNSKPSATAGASRYDAESGQVKKARRIVPIALAPVSANPGRGQAAQEGNGSPAILPWPVQEPNIEESAHNRTDKEQATESMPGFSIAQIAAAAGKKAGQYQP